MAAASGKCWNFCCAELDAKRDGLCYLASALLPVVAG
jgi:hypothetical protein